MDTITLTLTREEALEVTNLLANFLNNVLEPEELLFSAFIKLAKEIDN